MHDEKETEHLARVLEETRRAVKTENTFRLHQLSDQTIHSSSIYQHTDYIITAVLIYSIYKIIERKDNLKIKDWDKLMKKIDLYLTISIEAVNKNQQEKFLESLEKIRKSLAGVSGNLKSYIQEVLKKASINKASKLYEHGISLGQTAKLLGLTQWELLDYIGEKNISDPRFSQTINTKSRAKMALEFFS